MKGNQQEWRGGERPVYAHKYLRCVGLYDPSVGHGTGCGALFTEESEKVILDRCPLCGEQLRVYGYNEEQRRRHIVSSAAYRDFKIYQFDCVKCGNAFSNKQCCGTNEHCDKLSCPCKACCERASKLLNRIVAVMKGEGFATALRLWREAAGITTKPGPLAKHLGGAVGSMGVEQ